MTVIDERAAPSGAGDQAPPHAAPRRAYEVGIGWHVRAGGRFLLVERVDPLAPNGQGVSLCFAGGSLLTCARGDRLWTRTPEEQLLYVSTVELPNRAGGYKPPRGTPVVTPFSGSAAGHASDGMR